MEHDHSYPHPQVQDDNPKCEDPEAPEEEPNQPNPLCTPSPVPQPAPRMPSPPAVNIPARPQHECRVPLRPGNVYGEQRHPIKQLQDIESASQWRQTVGEAFRPPQLDTLDHIPGGFPDTSAMASEEDVQKMCKEEGANLV